MQGFEAFVARWRVCGAMLLWLALSGLDARAAMLPAEIAPHEVAATGAISREGPNLRECLPCVYCYTAPPPSVQGFSGECKDPEPPSWSHLAKAPIATVAGADRVGQRASPTPLRVAYCRWSN